MKFSLCISLGTLGSLIAGCLGGWDASIITLLIFMFIDYVSGLILAGIFKKSRKTETGALKSNICIKGLFKKCMMIMFVVVANRLDVQIGVNYIRDAICVAFITNELISIVENVGLMGIPLPSFIKNMIDVLKQQTSTKEEKVANSLNEIISKYSDEGSNANNNEHN